MKKLLALLLTAILAVSCLGMAPASAESTTVQRFLVSSNEKYDSYGDQPDGGRGGYDDTGYYGGDDEYDYAAGPLDFIWGLIDRIIFGAYDDDSYGGYYGDDYYGDSYYDDGYYDDGYYDDSYYSDDYYDDSYYGDYYDDEYYDEDVIAVFSIQDGALLSQSGNLSADDLSTYEKMWERIALIIPDEYENMIVKFEIASDGVDGSLAYVYNEDSSLKTWTISLDPADVVLSNGNLTSDFDANVIHEFGHLLTLNNYQMDSSATNTYVTEEGTLKEDSYLNLFYAEFWEDIMDEYRSTVGNNPDDNYYLFYEDHTDLFVSEYAAYNPEEDIAESFCTFVLEDEPTGSRIKDQKVAFFYRFEELVEIRDAIRANIMN